LAEEEYMEAEKRMTVADLICYMRQQLLEAKIEKNNELIKDLQTLLNIIFKVAEIKEDKTLTLLLDKLLYAMSDYFIDDEWKSEIPSEEEINSKLS